MSKTAGPASGEIVVLCCERALKKGELGPEERLESGSLTIRPAIIPCSSKVEVSYLLRILEDGADGVEVIACPDGHCKFLVGNVRAERRVDYAKRLLERVGMGAGRLGITRADGLTRKDVVAMAEKRAGESLALGPNPMKEERNR